MCHKTQTSYKNMETNRTCEGMKQRIVPLLGQGLVQCPAIQLPLPSERSSVPDHQFLPAADKVLESRPVSLGVPLLGPSILRTIFRSDLDVSWLPHYDEHYERGNLVDITNGNHKQNSNVLQVLQWNYGEHFFNNLKWCFCESSLLPLFRAILCSLFRWSSDDKLEKLFGSSLYSQVDLLVHLFVYSTAY